MLSFLLLRRSNSPGAILRRDFSPVGLLKPVEGLDPVGDSIPCAIGLNCDKILIGRGTSLPEYGIPLLSNVAMEQKSKAAVSRCACVPHVRGRFYYSHRKHAEICRQIGPKGTVKWLLTDLNSVNGIFVNLIKVDSAILKYVLSASACL
jgi:hypothetical protein